MNIVEFFGTVVKPKLIKGKNMFCPIETGKIAETISCIRDKDVNMFLYHKGDNIFAIDCGYKNSSNIERGLKQLDISGDDVKAIFLTHLDLDHAGGVDKRCKQVFPNAKLYLNQEEEEEKYLTNQYVRKKLLFMNLKSPIKLNDNYETLTDMQIKTIGDTTIQAVNTFGHTLGHTSYLIDDNLFVGDSLVLNHTGGYCFYDFWNIDSELNKQSLHKLKQLALQKNIKMILTSHTGYTTDLTSAFVFIDEDIDWKQKGFQFIENAPTDLFR